MPVTIASICKISINISDNMNGNETVITTNPESSSEASYLPPSRFRRPLIVLAIIVTLLLLSLAVFLVIKRFRPVTNTPVKVIENTETATGSLAVILPTLESPLSEQSSASSTMLNDLALDALAFSDFYEAPSNDFKANFKDYKLPLNVKIDVVNYYDVSRKLSLDPYIDTVNSQGFALIDNPWAQTGATFSSIYDNLDAKQLPLLVTSDFLLYYYQNTTKRVFKDIEESVFYNNLWDMSQELYQVAKTRYEARLALIGNINDPVLEAQRLETAFFAVALELLKPQAEQISISSEDINPRLFALSEKDRFYFVVPPYLRDDVLAEVSLVRAAQAVKAKSPVMLYDRDYREFVVPKEYKQNSKLNNFYLATGWLNSVFPLNYRSSDCPDCLLDKADWRINLTAASLISQDFSTQTQLKNRWARIYKVMSYFQGLREDLNYTHYRDSLTELFGANFQSEELFATKNKEAGANLDKLQAKLLTYRWPEIAGALNHEKDQAKIGLKVLSESYWPNDYIFSQLTTPAVGKYLGQTVAASNQTTCRQKNNTNRCYGSVFDPINLAYPVTDNAYFTENSNYQDYSSQAEGLRTELDELSAWQANNYWNTLYLSRVLLSTDKTQSPLFTRSSAWQDRNLKAAAGAWINLQLPLQNYSLSASDQPEQKLAFSRNPDNVYVEPNLALINELLANNTMLLATLNALHLNAEIRPSLADVNNLSRRLTDLRDVVQKELSGEALDKEDNDKIINFVRELTIDAPTAQAQQIAIKMPAGGNLNLDLSRFKLLVLVRQEGDSKIFAVGPVWAYRESR